MAAQDSSELLHKLIAFMEIKCQVYGPCKGAIYVQALSPRPICIINMYVHYAITYISVCELVKLRYYIYMPRRCH